MQVQLIVNTLIKIMDYKRCSCGSLFKQWRVFLYCFNNECNKKGEMISLHRINQPNVFSDFFKEHRGLPIEN